MLGHSYTQIDDQNLTNNNICSAMLFLCLTQKHWGSLGLGMQEIVERLGSRLKNLLATPLHLIKRMC